MLAASCTLTYAQSATPQPPVVTKAQFTSQVTALNTVLTTNNTEAANAKWEDVHRTMINELTVIKYKMRDAQEAKNETEMKKYTEVMIKQRNVYSEVLKLARDEKGMAPNKTQINEKLKEFGNMIL